MGSDFSATSLASIASVNSELTAKTASSDGGPAVQSLMQNLAANFNISEIAGQLPPLEGGAMDHPLNSQHPLLSSNDQQHPLMSSNDQQHPLLRSNDQQHPLLRNNDHPLLRQSDNVPPMRRRHGRTRSRGHLRTQSMPLPPLHEPPSTNDIVFQMDRPSFARAESDLSLGFDQSSQQFTPPYGSAANSPPPSPPNSGPPIQEVVTTPDRQLVLDGGMSDDFLSMLHEPIYEIDVDPNEGL